MKYEFSDNCMLNIPDYSCIHNPGRVSDNAFGVQYVTGWITDKDVRDGNVMVLSIFVLYTNVKEADYMKFGIIKCSGYDNRYDYVMSVIECKEKNLSSEGRFKYKPLKYQWNDLEKGDFMIVEGKYSDNSEFRFTNICKMPSVKSGGYYKLEESKGAYRRCYSIETKRVYKACDEEFYVYDDITDDSVIRGYAYTREYLWERLWPTEFEYGVSKNLLSKLMSEAKEQGKQVYAVITCEIPVIVFVK